MGSRAGRKEIKIRMLQSQARQAGTGRPWQPATDPAPSQLPSWLGLGAEAAAAGCPRPSLHTQWDAGSPRLCTSPQQGNNSLELSGALARDPVSVTDPGSSLVVSQNEANENKPKRSGSSGVGALGIPITGVVARGRSLVLTAPGVVDETKSSPPCSSKANTSRARRCPALV